MPLVIYAKNIQPIEKGVYACRVPSSKFIGLYEDIFLMWFNNQWSYCGSDQKYRGEVSGWIGPLERKLND